MFKFSPKGALVGCGAAILWCWISWMILPWHSFSELKNELQLSEVVATSVIEKGVYIMPNMPGIMDRDSLAIYQEKKFKGPTGIMFISPNGAMNFSFSMFLFLGGNFLAAVLFSFLLTMTHNLSILQKAIFVSMAAMTGGVVSFFPFWAWWQLPGFWVFIQILDLGIGWFFGGLAIAKFGEINKKSENSPTKSGFRSDDSTRLVAG